MNLGRLIWIIVQSETRRPFQNGQAVVINRLRFKNDGRTANPDRDCLCRKLGAAGIFFRVEKDRAAVETYAAPGFVHTENRIRAKSRDCQIGER